jgi:hypothetical protein
LFILFLPLNNHNEALSCACGNSHVLLKGIDRSETMILREM